MYLDNINIPSGNILNFEFYRIGGDSISGSPVVIREYHNGIPVTGFVGIYSEWFSAKRQMGCQIGIVWSSDFVDDIIQATIPRNLDFQRLRKSKF